MLIAIKRIIYKLNLDFKNICPNCRSKDTILCDTLVLNENLIILPVNSLDAFVMLIISPNRPDNSLIRP